MGKFYQFIIEQREKHMEDRDERDAPEVGACSFIDRQAVGQALATAAVRKVRELAATEYGLTRLRARVTLNNPASRKVLEHNGFVAVGELTLNGKPAMSYICELR